MSIVAFDEDAHCGFSIGSNSKTIVYCSHLCCNDTPCLDFRRHVPGLHSDTLGDATGGGAGCGRGGQRANICSFSFVNRRHTIL